MRNASICTRGLAFRLLLIACEMTAPSIASHHLASDERTRQHSGPNDQLQEALRSIRTHLGMDVAFISQFSEGQRTFRYVDCDSAIEGISAGVSAPLENTYCSRVVNGELPELSGDADVSLLAPDPVLSSAMTIRSYVSVPIRLSDGSIYGTFCVAGSSADESLNQRDLNAIRAFAEMAAGQMEQRERAQRRFREVESRVRRVLDEDALAIVYQPILDIVHDVIVGYESLSRFAAEPHRSPDLWFADAAEVGLGAELESRAMEKALRAVALVPAPAYISINASPARVTAGDVERLVRDVPCERVVLELTEHAMIADYELVIRACETLRACGIRIAIDDAGAGYASFRHILAVRPDFIKLDMALTRGIEDDTSRQALTAAFVAFAARTGCDLIAEGVETPAALETLRSLGITRAQGYLLGRPEVRW